MKRFLFLLLACSISLPCALATNLNFQNPSDNSSIIEFSHGNIDYEALEWIESTTAGNNYIKITGSRTGAAGPGPIYMMLPNAYATDYAAATYYGSSGGTSGNNPAIILLSSVGGLLYEWQAVDAGPTRYEVIIEGGQAYIYNDGVVVANSTPLATSPYFVGFGYYNYGLSASTYWQIWDDYVYGSSENPYVASMPESDETENQVVLYKDITDPATHGTAYSENFTIINSNILYGSWSRGNSSPEPPEVLGNESIQFVNFVTGKVIATNYTGTAYLGSIALDVESILFDAGEPQGFYALYWPDHASYSNIIEYRSNGASVSWSSHSYSIGDTGSVIYFVLDGGYWSTDYSYKMTVLDVYGNFKQNTTITAQTGTITQEWTEDDYDEGVYYAWLIATDTDGSEYILGGDYTTLYAQALLYGWVMEDKTGNTIPALINCTYDSSWENTSTSASGNYTTAAVFLSGTTPGCNVSATGYQTYWWNATLLSGASKLVNFTLQSDTHSNLGLAAGGVDRDNPYHNPIPDKYIELVNTSNSESYNTTTNIAGWWMVDNLTSGRLYCATGYKSGYTNTTRCETVI